MHRRLDYVPGNGHAPYSKTRQTTLPSVRVDPALARTDDTEETPAPPALTNPPDAARETPECRLTIAQMPGDVPARRCAHLGRRRRCGSGARFRGVRLFPQPANGLSSSSRSRPQLFARRARISSPRKGLNMANLVAAKETRHPAKPAGKMNDAGRPAPYPELRPVTAANESGAGAHTAGAPTAVGRLGVPIDQSVCGGVQTLADLADQVTNSGSAFPAPPARLWS